MSKVPHTESKPRIEEVARAPLGELLEAIGKANEEMLYAHDVMAAVRLALQGAEGGDDLEPLCSLLLGAEQRLLDARPVLDAAATREVVKLGRGQS